MMGILTATASARAAEISGGGALLSPEIVTALFSGLAMLIGAVAALVWGNRRISRLRDEIRIANSPLAIDKLDKPITRAEYQQFRCEISKRIDAIGPALNRLFAKISEVDTKAEERSIATHRRLDPILEKVASNMSEVELMKKIMLEKMSK